MRSICILSLCVLTLAKIQGQDLTNENLFDYQKGARVVAYSSNYGGAWDVEYILENNPSYNPNGLATWCTEQNAPFPHFATVELSKDEWLDIIEFNNEIPDETGGWEGISAKDVEVYVSTTSKDQGFSKVINVRLEYNKSHQIIKVNPVLAKWVKFVITSNYGNEEYTEFGQIGAYDDKQRKMGINEEIEKNGFINLYGIYFDFGSDNLKPESLNAIEQVVAYLNNSPTVKILIEGHTDNIGSDNANLVLSEKEQWL